MGVENENENNAGDADAGAGGGAPAARTRGGRGGRVDDATLLAELAAGEHEKAFGKPKPAEGKEPKPAAEDQKPDGAEQEALEEEVVEEEEDPDEVEGEEKPDDEEDPDDLDAATKKKLAGVQRAEKRFREQMATDKAELARVVAGLEKEWKPKIEAAEKFEQLKARAKYAPDVVLEALGLGPDDWESAARLLYAKSQAGQKDPRTREAAARLMREREKEDALASTQRELRELKERIESGEKQAAAQTAVESYLDTIAKAASKAEAPLVKRMLEKTPKKARALLHQAASDLADELGEVPDPIDVLQRLEEKERKELEERGIDPKSVAGISSSSERANGGGNGGGGGAGGNGRKPARTLAKTGAGAAQQRKKPASRDEEFEETRRALESGNLED